MGKDLNPELTYNLACFYALAAAAAHSDSRLTEEYAHEAIRLLNRCLDKGFFRDPFALPNARRDEDLKSLRPRPDFQQLLNKADDKKRNQQQPGNTARGP